MYVDWQKQRDETEAWHIKSMEKAMKGGSAAFDFYGAGLKSRASVKDLGLWPGFDEDGNEKYTVRQGIKAACVAKEDVGGILIIQLALLKRLDLISSMLMVVIGLLAFIAYKVY